MQRSPQFQAVVDIIREWHLSKKTPFDHLLNQYFRDRRYIGSKDRQQISLYAYELFRHKLILEWWAEWAMKQPCIEAEEAYGYKILAVYLTLVEKRSPGYLRSLYNNQTYGMRLMNRLERQMVETLWNKPSHGKDPLFHDQMPDHVRVNTPKWLYDLIAPTPAGPLKLDALNQPATVDLRVNTLKTSRDAIMDNLENLGVKATTTPYSPWGIRLTRRTNLNTVDAYKNGLVEIQDEGSQVLCMVTDAKPNQTIIDYCAGAGGKSLALGMMMNNKGTLILCDTAEWRLSRSVLRLRKADVFNVQHKVVLGTPQGQATLETFKHQAEIVLIDAPCSGTGTWRRNPDARFRTTAAELQSLTETQSAILKDAAAYVRPGGLLVYATCSILPQENDDQVHSFLAQHPEFSLDPIPFAGKTYETLHLSPHVHKTDGFFVARLRKRR